MHETHFSFKHQAMQNMSRYNQKGMKQQIKQYPGNPRHYFVFLTDLTKVEKAISIKTILEKETYLRDD